MPRSIVFAVACAAVAGAARSGAAQEVRRAPNPADVQFMAGMIVHHGQALVMAGWAPTHDASASLRVLCERIIVAQRDEIAAMARWLGERGLPVPDPDRSHGAAMPGMTHGPLMPGMLTATELAVLDSARGPAFDRLFLTYMIRHHRGAIAMVEQLLGSHGAAQDGLVARIAIDVNADQSAEIERMQRMLAGLPAGGHGP